MNAHRCQPGGDDFARPQRPCESEADSKVLPWGMSPRRHGPSQFPEGCHQQGGDGLQGDGQIDPHTSRRPFILLTLAGGACRFKGNGSPLLQVW